MKAIYFGAGLDTRPLINLDDVKEFIYIDCQPYSEFGNIRSGNLDEDGYDYYERPNFINKIITEFKKVGFNLKTNIFDTLYFSNSNDTIVKYYINISIPDDINLIFDELDYFDYLIVAGYHPSYKIMNYIDPNKKVNFVGFYDTYYGNSEFEFEDNIISKLYSEKVFRNNFLKFYYFDINNELKVFNDWKYFSKNLN